VAVGVADVTTRGVIVIRSRPLAAASLAVLLGVAASPAGAQSPTAPASCPPITTSAPAASFDPADQPDLTVFAAASLSNAFEDLVPLWKAAHPGSDLALAFDASSALRAQVEEGAPADVLASADTRNAQALVDACLAPGPITPFAGNSLVVIVPTGNPAGIGAATDLARPGVRVVAAGPDVPITRYTSAVIEYLAAGTDDPAAFIAAVTANTVSEEDNVRAVLAKVELGEGDAAIVYATDAASTDAVETVPIPTEADVPATYAAVAVADAAQPALAAEFLAFLVAPEAQAVLEARGFLPVTDVAAR
jgi:molybdate transport system substrate-binding protein